MPEEIKVSHRSRKRVKEVKRKARPGKPPEINLEHSAERIEIDLRIKPLRLACNWFEIGLVENHRRLAIIWLLSMSFLVAELNDKGAWTSLRYAEHFDCFTKFEDNCERIDVHSVSCEEFIEKFEKPYKPVVVLGVQVSDLFGWKIAIWRNFLGREKQVDLESISQIDRIQAQERFSTSI